MSGDLLPLLAGLFWAFVAGLIVMVSLQRRGAGLISDYWFVAACLAIAGTLLLVFLAGCAVSCDPETLAECPCGWSDAEAGAGPDAAQPLPQDLHGVGSETRHPY